MDMASIFRFFKSSAGTSVQVVVLYCVVVVIRVYLETTATRWIVKLYEPIF